MSFMLQFHGPDAATVISNTMYDSAAFKVICYPTQPNGVAAPPL